MNGKELLEAMSYVDEAYIDDAEQSKPRRRIIRWQPLAAAAACLALVFTAWQIMNPAPKFQAAMVSEVMPEMSARSSGSAPEEAVANEEIMLLSITAEMTVRITGMEDNVLLCVVTDPGTGSYSEGEELKIALPEESDVSADLDSTASRAQSPLMRVIYAPGEEAEGIIQALELTPVEE